MLSTKFRFIWQSGFGEDFYKSNNQKQELPVVAMFVNGSGRNDHSLQRTAHRCFLPSFCLFGRDISEEKLFQKSSIKKRELLMTAMFVTGSKQNEHSPQRTFHRCFLPRFGPFGQAVTEQKIFRNQPIRNKNCLWRPCLLMDRDKMSNLYREHSIDASYKVSVHLAKRFQRTRFLEIDQLETRIACDNPI